MRAPLLALVLLIACSAGRDSLPDGDPIPPDTGLVVGAMDFSAINWNEVMSVRQVGGREFRLEPKTPLFGIPLPPGRYELRFFSFYRPETAKLTFEVRAGEAAYVGSWYGVLGPHAELKDELDSIRPELERRWGVRDVVRAMPAKPGVIRFVFDPTHPDAPRSKSY